MAEITPNAGFGKRVLRAAASTLLSMALPMAALSCATAPGHAISSPSDTTSSVSEPPRSDAAKPRSDTSKAAIPLSGREGKAAAAVADVGELESASLAPAPMAKRPAPSPGEAPVQSGLNAGYADDNAQFNYFVKFLDEYKDVPHYELDVRERIVLKILDAEGKPIMNAALSVSSGSASLARGRTYADGCYPLYPLELGDGTESTYRVEARAFGASASIDVERSGPRTVVLRLDARRAIPAPMPVDVLFILDTTGSMGEEIERLRATIEIIDANVSALRPRPDLRFGMVLYKDRDDEYDTRIVPLTSDLGRFKEALDEVYAEGGGDDPEDLQAALGAAIDGVSWNGDGLRLGFVITDAAAHLDYGQDYSYARAAREAVAAGIKLFSIGVGGLPLDGEYVLRQIAQYTRGKYIFLTYGEKGESEGGRELSVSHHTGSNYATDKLEAIVIRFVKEEIARQSDRELESDDAYYSARRVADESREETLDALFSRALGDLSDYSSLRVGGRTPCAIMPIAAPDGPTGSLAAQAEYFGSRLALAASSSKRFTLVERESAHLQEVLGELELQLSALADERSAAEVGKLIGAEVLVTGRLFERDGRYELFLKLLRVETAEVLSASRALIDRDLGL